MSDDTPSRINIEEYTADLDPKISSLVKETRRLVFSLVPNAGERYKWSRPWYELGGSFCYIMAYSDHVNLGFPRGAELVDRFDILEGTGKGMRHTKIRIEDDLKLDSVSALVLAAVELNKTK
jgi:hypothetical protein